MDDTHAHGNGDERATDPATAVDELAALDPADAPGAAERLAADLAADLEDIGAAPQSPVQLRAELGDGSAS